MLLCLLLQAKLALEIPHRGLRVSYNRLLLFVYLFIMYHLLLLPVDEVTRVAYRFL